MLKVHTKLEITIAVSGVISNERIFSNFEKSIVVTYTGTSSARQSAAQGICDFHWSEESELA
jgi:hypothetical protein